MSTYIFPVRNGTPKAGQTDPKKEINTCWSVDVFRTVERFIDALRDYVGPQEPCPPAAGSPANPAGNPPPPPPPLAAYIDTPTGLLILSCYARLIQIFGVAVFVVETFAEMACPSSYVQLRLGGFAPHPTAPSQRSGPARRSRRGDG
ncbi:bae3afa9-07d6-4cb4-8ebe-eda77dc655db [Thermothielavioides terrestris]|uniref:Uncharacterized protein n=2 Tax=Thermothielavioides terrestris TaxID=2587410 RepID=G2RI77_THETT|nr:uncharacterized protein THITE_2093036 [Thermothielavioides terrestris NRRL 8126]AEO71539.1 hypothetical protein THITE_2093036 [Thermothielavioides terrestris NRRL 8126]SPQ27476.1 bae3afa9-07d6-4cb4-8ebe-eda77dc655db [Thermothielavioides terrestris]